MGFLVSKIPVEGGSLPRKRTEVLDRASMTHLGHVFDDGPNPTGRADAEGFVLFEIKHGGLASFFW